MQAAQILDEPEFSPQKEEESSTQVPTLSTSRSYTILKRLFDLTLAILLAPLLLPFMALIALAIKFSSRGPLFYAHTRVGYQGKTFSCYKFRTMVLNAEEKLAEVLKCPQKKAEWDQNYKLKKDPRITKIGSFLRKTSLDELPQFFNVIKGEMSFVGPRPITQNETKLYGNKYIYYKNTLPGITGLWQISGRSNTNYSNRVQLDKTYYETRSLRSDFYILLKTIPVVLWGRGAY